MTHVSNGSLGWKPEPHGELYRRLAFRFGTWADRPEGQVFAERFDRGASIKRIANLCKQDPDTLITEATEIY